MKRLFVLLVLLCTLNANAQNSPYEAAGQGLGALIGVIVDAFSTPKGTPSNDPTLDSGVTKQTERYDPYWKNQAKKEKLELCLDSDFQRFFIKTPCDLVKMTSKQLNDASFAATADIKNIELIEYKYLFIADLEADDYLANTKPINKAIELSNLRKKESEDFLGLMDKLSFRKITWGEFNQERLKLSSAYADKYVKIATSSP